MALNKRYDLKEQGLSQGTMWHALRPELFRVGCEHCFGDECLDDLQFATRSTMRRSPGQQNHKPLSDEHTGQDYGYT